MMPQGPGSNMNVGTPCCAVYPVVCFDDSHSYTVVLIKLRACVCMFHSLALNISSVSTWTRVLETDYMCYHTQGQVIELIFSKGSDFFQTHTLSNGTTSRRSLAVYPPDDEMNLFWLRLLQDLLFLQEIYAQYIQDRSLSPPPPPLEISYSKSPVLPISPGCLQGLCHISHSPCPNLNYVYYNSTRRCFQNQYVIGCVKEWKWNDHRIRTDVEDWHAAFGVCGLRDCFLFCVRWSEAALGLGFRGFVRLLKMFLFTFPAAAF